MAGKMEIKELENAVYDPLFHAKRITDVGSDDQKPWDDTSTANVVYLGRAGAGVAESATGWLIRRIDLTTKKSVAVIGIWNDRTTLF